MSDPQQIPVRLPPPLGRSKVVNGVRVPIMEQPVIECGQEVRLAGKLVVCIRRFGHPVAINYGHTNGYDEWCFDV
jgi:hypothetical protein